jgi:hypothetical protein
MNMVIDLYKFITPDRKIPSAYPHDGLVTTACSNMYPPMYIYDTTTIKKWSFGELQQPTGTSQ